MIASSSSHAATTSSASKDGMLSVALSHLKIKQILESFLNTDDNSKSATDSQRSNPSSTAILLDDLFMNFGLRVRIIVQQRQNGQTTIAVHLGIIGVDVIKDQCLRNLEECFGEGNVNDCTSGIKSKELHPLDTVAEGFDICIRVMSDNLPPNLTANQACTLLSDLHVTILGGELKHAFSDLANGKKQGPLTFSIPIQRRPVDDCNPQCVIVHRQNDRITVTFPFAFPQETDCALAKLFLQQFKLAQRQCLNQRHGKFVPMVDYFRSNDPPREIKGFENDNEDLHHSGYLSLTFLEHHVDNEEKIQKAATNVLMLHTFLDYHIKCAKSNLNSRMRFKKEALEKQLFE